MSFLAQFWTYGIRFFAILILCDCRVDSRLVTTAHPPTHLVLFLCGFPSWSLCWFHGCAGVSTQLSVWLCAALLRTFSYLCHASLFVAQGGNLFACAHRVLCENTPSRHGQCLSHGHRLCRDVAVVLIASIASWISAVLPYLICSWKLEINGT